MNTKKRLIEFILHGKPDKFKSVLKEEISNRATDFIYNLMLNERKELLTKMKSIESCESKQPINVQENTKFYPESSYQLRDGNVGILDHNERENISKLYENLNTNNKERLLKVLTESQQSFSRIIKLANLENKKDLK